MRAFICTMGLPSTVQCTVCMPLTICFGLCSNSNNFWTTVMDLHGVDLTLTVIYFARDGGASAFIGHAHSYGAA